MEAGSDTGCEEVDDSSLLHEHQLGQSSDVGAS